jgi:hypothetical protein
MSAMPGRLLGAKGNEICYYASGSSSTYSSSLFTNLFVVFSGGLSLPPFHGITQSAIVIIPEAPEKFPFLDLLVIHTNRPIT